MRRWMNLIESASRALYHGTLREYLPQIKDQGLVPTVGDFVSHFYDPSGDEGYDPETDSLEPLVFAASKKDLQRCLSAILHRLRQKGIRPTPENVILHGAIVVIRDHEEQFYHRPHDDNGRDYADHPTQVEPGDFYAHEDINPSHIVTGKRLRDLLRRNRVGIYYSPRPPLRESSDDQYAYHATFKRNVPGIAEHGLVCDQDTNFDFSRTGRLYASTQDGAEWYAGELGAGFEEETVLLRFPIPKNISADEIGNEGDFWFRDNIPASLIQIESEPGGHFVPIGKR